MHDEPAMFRTGAAATLPYSIDYVETDIPPGMTLAEWRRSRARLQRRQARHRGLGVAVTRLRRLHRAFTDSASTTGRQR